MKIKKVERVTIDGVKLLKVTRDDNSTLLTKELCSGNSIMSAYTREESERRKGK